MTRPTRPEVSDPDLRTTLERVGSYIENYTANLDAISNDIKAMEKYLAESGIRLRASVPVKPPVIETGDFECFKIDERLEWAPEDDDIPFETGNSRWRIMYHLNRAPGRFDEDRFIANGDDAETIERRPLIETSIAIRLKTHRHLAALVHQIGKTVEVWPKPYDDIPFEFDGRIP
jgi:hypothetical protein